MKQDLTHTLVALKKEELQELCREVKETLATGIVFPEAAVKTKEASFGIADLWKLQGKMKTAGRAWNRINNNLIIRG